MRITILIILFFMLFLVGCMDVQRNVSGSSVLVKYENLTCVNYLDNNKPCLINIKQSYAVINNGEKLISENQKDRRYDCLCYDDKNTIVLGGEQK